MSTYALRCQTTGRFKIGERRDRRALQALVARNAHHSDRRNSSMSLFGRRADAEVETYDERTERRALEAERDRVKRQEIIERNDSWRSALPTETRRAHRLMMNAIGAAYFGATTAQELADAATQALIDGGFLVPVGALPPSDEAEESA